MTRRPSHVAAVTAFTAVTGMAGTAFAQRQADALEEIIVTAERRANTEATTAISIEILTDDFIAENQIKDIIDLQNAVPALQFFQNGSYVQANIRGVGNPSRGGPSEQVGVPVFFDGATQGEEMGIASGFFDISGIEVVRGPQATFVGQGAAGGAILINSARPNFDGLNGFIEGTVGTYGQRKILGAVNLPIAEKVAGRLAYMSETRDSYYTNVAGVASPGAGEQWVPGDQQDQNFRLGLLWEPTENFSLWTKFEESELHTYGPTQQPNPNSYIGFYNHDNDPNTPSLQVTTYAPHYQGPAPGTGTIINGVQFGGTPGPGGALYDPLDPWELANAYPQERITDVNRQSIEATWTLGNGMTFRSLSSNIVMDRLQTEGGDSLVYQSYQGWQLGPGMQTWSQEFNLISPSGERLEWLVGLYQNDRHTELHFNNPANQAPTNILNCGWQYNSSWTPCPTSFRSDLNRFMWSSLDDVVHKAVFAQLNFHFTDSVELAIEARQNDDDNRQIRATYTGATLAPTGVNTVPCKGNVEGQIYYCPPPGEPNLSTSNQIFVWKGDIPTYKVGLNWEPADGHFFYAFFARGYKAGQSTAFTATPVFEEVVDDIEIGWKGTLRPGLYAELGLYSMDYQDMQLSTFQTADFEARQATSNIGDSTIEGFEGSIRAVIGNFGINASVAYTDSELGEITTLDTRALQGVVAASGGVYPGDSSKGCVPANATLGSCFDYSPYFINFSGAENPFSPKLTYMLSFDYAFQLSNGATIRPSITLNHADSTYTNTLQTPGDLYYRTDDRDVLNFSVSFENDIWDLQLFATNVTDELYIEGHSNTGASVFYGDPMVVGVRARMEF